MLITHHFRLAGCNSVIMKPVGGIGSAKCLKSFPPSFTGYICLFLGITKKQTSGDVFFRCERSQKWGPNITVIERKPHGIVPNLTGFVRVGFPKSESTGQRVVISSMKLFENSEFVQPLVS